MPNPLLRILAAVLSFVALATPVFAQSRDSAMIRTRIRVVGVFDRQTGEPVEGAEVRDYNSGFTALTTKTGTVALLLSDTLGTLVNIKKIGFNQQTIMVATAIEDTIPLTIDLLRAGQLLATMVVMADGRSFKLGPFDTSQTLLDNGFYERRATSAAPADAFITGDRLRATTMLSDARFLGRGICEETLFIDGVRMGVEKRNGVFTHEGIDALLDPSIVAGIETYRFGDLPSSTTHTFAGLGALSTSVSAATIANGLNSMTAMGCVTMIWLKR
ncbi:MAG TPA: hypothetical protein VGM82_00700 [Gemmatimonadaceae bacterium]|jgi:hypothetical protein